MWHPICDVYSPAAENNQTIDKRDKIICLVGPSGSGKTTIAKELEKAGYNVIQSYTTRTPREPNEWGHIFVDTKFYIQHKKQDMENGHGIIAETYFDKNYYWAAEWQYQGKGTSIYVIDVAGVKMLREKVKDADIVVIYIQTDWEIRKQRMIWRYNTTHENSIAVDGKLNEMYDRMDNDYKIFKVIPCDYVIDNNGTLEEAVQAIKSIIEGGE